jgi:hypothetical protein
MVASSDDGYAGELVHVGSHLGVRQAVVRMLTADEDCGLQYGGKERSESIIQGKRDKAPLVKCL